MNFSMNSRTSDIICNIFCNILQFNVTVNFQTSFIQLEFCKIKIEFQKIQLLFSKLKKHFLTVTKC